jgi:hypothetical protein
MCRSYNVHHILYQSIKKVIKHDLGESLYYTLIHHICKQSGLSEKELLTNYDLFERSLFNVLGNTGANLILGRIRHEILIQAVLQYGSTLSEDDIRNPTLSFNNIIRDIASSQIFEFIHKISLHKHVTFLYSTEDSKQKALSAFFNTSVTENPITFDSSETLSSHQRFEHSEPGHSKPPVGVG